jgi:SAM-dependent methyltransferase
MMQTSLRRNRAEVEHALRTVEGREYFSPALLAQYRVLIPLLREHASGRVIDLGAGDAPFRKYLPEMVTRYHTLEMQPRSEDVTYIGDVQQMPMIASESYDTAICLETLEHVPEPWRAAGEIHRILAPGGTLILSVPHLSRLHDVPNDFYRFNAYGVRYLLESTDSQ